MTPCEDWLLRIAEVAAYTGLTPAVIRAYARKGDITIKKYGRQTRFCLSDVNAFLEKNNMKPHETYLKLLPAAKYINKHFTTLITWELKQKLVPIRTPGGWRLYRKSDLDNYLNREKLK